MDNERMAPRTMPEDVLGSVKEGMEVYDSAGEKIGKVEGVFLGAGADMKETPGLIPETAPAILPDDSNPLLKGLTEAFGGSANIPAVLINRLRYNGFIRIDPHGLFKHTRFALREQVASVSDKRVNLSVRESELIKS